MAGGICGNPGMPGTITGGLGRNEDSGDGGNFAFAEVAIEEEVGVMTVEDIEDNPVNQKHMFWVINFTLLPQ